MQYLPTWPDLLFEDRETPRGAPAERAPLSSAEGTLTVPVLPAPAVLYPREVYSVDGRRVTKEASTGWLCDCTLVPNLQCEHVREALRLQAVREARKTDDSQLARGRGPAGDD